MSGAVQVVLRPLEAGDSARLLAWRNLLGESPAGCTPTM